MLDRPAIFRRARRTAKSIGRWMYWASTRLLPKGIRPYRFPGGRIYIDITDSPSMLKRVLYLYERPKRKALERLLTSSMTFVDVGANMGDFSLLAAKRVGPNGRVLAVEPHPDNCALIRRSASLNGYENIEVHELALSDQQGAAVLHLGERNAWHTLVANLPQRQAGDLEIKQNTLDALLPDRPFVGVIKIDVEGAEISVLKGSEKTLRSAKSVDLLLDLHPRLGVDTREVERLLSDMGFSFFNMQGGPLNQLPAGTGEVLARKG